ncbi:MAG: flavin reductase family protein [Acidimicrobiia bacterium]
MIDPKLKRALGQMIKGVQVVGAQHDGEIRAYCSHWVTQVAFEEPIVMASASPKHDTYPVMAAAGCFGISILAGDQVDVGQYFSYPGRRFHHIASEWIELQGDVPVVPDCIAWLRCETFERKAMGDHELFFARVTDYGYGRLKEPPLLYSSRHGWRVMGERARTPGESIRDRLLARVAEAGYELLPDAGDENEG